MNLDSLLTNWHFMRILRLVLSAFFLYDAIETKHIMPGILGAFLLFQAITNTGCCGADGCQVDKSKDIKNQNEEPEFEIIKPN